jgi:hypothetical protein
VKIKRDNKEQTLKGKIVLPNEEKDTFILINKEKVTINNAWLRG